MSPLISNKSVHQVTLGGQHDTIKVVDQPIAGLLVSLDHPLTIDGDEALKKKLIVNLI